jgi:hypothetical protein
MPNVLVNTSVAGSCYDVEDLFGTPVGQNFSIDEMKAMKCSEAMIWAKEIGIEQHPDFYVNFTDDGLMKNSSWQDFQCALYTMKGDDEAGTGWNCTYPCTSSLPQCPPPTPSGDKDLAGEGTPSSGSGFPWWAIALIALFVIGLIAVGIMYAMGMFGKKEGSKKKKRAVKPTKAAAAPAAPDPAPAPPAAPAVMTAPPVYLSQPVSTSFVAQPVATAAPVYAVAAPVASVAAPVPMYTAVAPTYTAAEPMYTAAAAVPTYTGTAPAPTYATYAAPVATFS